MCANITIFRLVDLCIRGFVYLFFRGACRMSEVRIRMSDKWLLYVYLDKSRRKAKNGFVNPLLYKISV